MAYRTSTSGSFTQRHQGTLAFLPAVASAPTIPSVRALRGMTPSPMFAVGSLGRAESKQWQGDGIASETFLSHPRA